MAFCEESIGSGQKTGNYSKMKVPCHLKKEEASTIIAMIASHMDTMTGYEEIINE